MKYREFEGKSRKYTRIKEKPNFWGREISENLDFMA